MSASIASGQVAVRDALRLARALMSLTARSMDYLVATSIACQRADIPIGSWFKIASGYGDWYVRLEQDGRGVSQPDRPQASIGTVVTVPRNAQPVTSALRSISRSAGAQRSSLMRTIKASDPKHRSPYVNELLTLYKSASQTPLSEELSAFRRWVDAEHEKYTLDAFVPALVALMVSCVAQREATAAQEQIRASVKRAGYTSVGRVRDRFLASPPFTSDPNLLINAGTDLMQSADTAVRSARTASNPDRMLDILYDALPLCLAARWLFDWCERRSADVSDTATAKSNRATETLVRLRAAFLHQVLDLDGQEWERLVLEFKALRQALGGQEARRLTKLAVNRHLLYPALYTDRL
jgi:hypothetical protein